MANVDDLVECVSEAAVPAIHRVQALQEASRLQPARLAQHSTALTACLVDGELEVRRAALEAMRCLEPSALAPLSGEVAERLADPRESWEIRLAALDTLKRLDGGALKQQAAKISACLKQGAMGGAGRAEVKMVRKEVLNLLNGMEPDALNAAAADITAALDVSEPDVLLAAAAVFQRLPAKALRSLAADIVGHLAHEDPVVRSAACGAVAKFDSDMLAQCAAGIACHWNGSDPKVTNAVHKALSNLGPEELVAAVPNVLAVATCSCADLHLRWQALRLLRTIGAQQLAPHAAELMLCLSRRDGDITKETLEILSCLSTDTLIPHAADILEHISDENPDVWQAAIRVIDSLAFGTESLSTFQASLLDAIRLVAKIIVFDVHRLSAKMRHTGVVDQSCIVELAKRQEPMALDEFHRHLHSVSVLVESSGPFLHLAAQHGQVLLVHVLVEHNRAWVKLQAANGDTALHVAAKHGQFQCCEVLLFHGALPKLPNNSNETPHDLAKKFPELHLHFAGLENYWTQRGGKGDAKRAALDDARRVIQVEWYTMKLRGVGSRFAQHSLIRVRVQGADPTDAHDYVIERARSRGGDSVFVSHWVDVQPNVQDLPIHTLSVADIQADTKVLRMKDVWEASRNEVPYDVGASNCHHGAMWVYNRCARPGRMITAHPDRFLTTAAWGLKNYFGIDLSEGNFRLTPSAESTVGGVQSTTPQIQSRVAARDVDDFPIDEAFDFHEDPWAATAARLAAWIYDPTTVEAEETVEVYNTTGCVGSVTIVQGPDKHLLYPGVKSVVLNAPEGRVRVGVEDDNERLVISDVELIGGCAYEVSRAPLNKLVLERCARLESCVRPCGNSICAHREHITLADGENLVQWAVATLGDTIFLTFMGTSDIRDIVIDLNVATYNHAPHGLRVHAGMWTVLHQFDCAVTSCGHERANGHYMLAGMEDGRPRYVVPCDPDVSIRWHGDFGEWRLCVPDEAMYACAVDTPVAPASGWQSLQGAGPPPTLRHRPLDLVRLIREREPNLRHLVICGHSLGGGSAIITALDALYEGVHDLSVVTFGAPHVVVPPRQRHPLWDALDGRATLYVRAWDAVPRLPSCLGWVDNVLPRCTNTDDSLLGWQINVSGLLPARLGGLRATFAIYDTVGTVVILVAGSQKVRRLLSKDPERRRLLEMEPPAPGPFVLKHHPINEYLNILELSDRGRMQRHRAPTACREDEGAQRALDLQAA